MSHLATADSDADFAQQQVERFREATKHHSDLTRHVANSAAALRFPDARFDAARCGIALYGISPFNTDPAEDGLRPALSWRSQIAQVRSSSRARAPATAAASSPGDRRGSGSCRSAMRTGSAVT